MINPWQIVVLSFLGLGFTTNTALALPWVERLEGGSAAIQNSGDTSYRSASVGARIGLDEAVLPSPRTRMVVRCPNNTRSSVVPGRISGIGLICPDLRITRRSRGGDDVLALNRGDFPYELRVIEELPMLIWPVPLRNDRRQSESRQISLYRVQPDGLEQIWQIEREGNLVRYDGPPLEVGGSYSLIVESTAVDTLCGEGEAGLERWRLGRCSRINLQRFGPEQEMELDNGLAAIEAGGLENDASFWAVVYAYQDAGLHQKVIASTVSLISGGEQPAAIHVLLANSYLQAGWFDEAQIVFEEAERLATRDGDFQTRLEARLGLVKVAAWRMQSEVAVDYLWAALRDASYQQDREQADVILQLIRKLS